MDEARAVAKSSGEIWRLSTTNQPVMMRDSADAIIDHEPVMLPEIVEALELHAGNTVVDATAGRGGHAQAMAKLIGPTGTIVLFDLDQSNLAFASDRVRKLPQPPRVEAIHSNFSNVTQELRQRSIHADAFLADLGFASNQMSDASRGLSFSNAGPLDMRLDQTKGESVQGLLARVSAEELADLIFQLGEDPFSRRIARRIIYIRDLGLLKTTADLAKAVVDAYGAKARQSRMHPATRTFMALRISVNKELESLEALLSQIQAQIANFHAGQAPHTHGFLGSQTHGFQSGASDAAQAHPEIGLDVRPDNWLVKNARIAILAFHSLEDRLIKRALTDWQRQGWITRVARKPLVASETECAANPRARSAKLRTARIVGV